MVGERGDNHPEESGRGAAFLCWVVGLLFAAAAAAVVEDDRREVLCWNNSATGPGVGLISPRCQNHR